MKCCVYTCNNKYKSKGQKVGKGDENNVTVIFHSFPTNIERKTVWINDIRKINGFTWEPKKSSFVCSEHFDKFSWERIREDGKRKLKNTAIPSIFKKNVTETSINDHTYPARVPLQDISNKKKYIGHLRSYGDHTYIRKSICSNDGRGPEVVSSVEKTTSEGKQNGGDTLETDETYSVKNEMHNIPATNVNNALDILNQCLEKDKLLDMCASSVNSVKSSAITSSEVQQNNMTHSSEIEDTQNALTNWVTEVKNNIATQTVIEQTIDTKIISLTKENGQLQTQLAELNKMLNKTLKQNEILRNSNRNMYKELNTWRNNKKREKEGILKNFNEDQKKVLCRRNSKGVKWDSATLKEALILKLKCGSSGYEEVRKQFPIPSLRTLQRRSQHIEFQPGILTEVFELIAYEMNNHREEWKDCVLALDEMAITAGEVIDRSSKQFIGRVTLECHEGFANKALVFVLGGIVFRWKQSICYHLTSCKAANAEKDATGKTYVQIINNIIEYGERIGLRIHCVISDMGSDNRSMWKILGIIANRSKVICSISHPNRSSSQLYIMPDVPHLFKAIKSMLVQNKVIYLPEDVVQSANLPSNEVSIEHIVDLADTEAYLELKVAFKIKKENLDKNNRFNSMKVSTAKSVFCQRTSSGLQLLSLVKKNPSYITTAWFVYVVNHWFDLMTSRHHILALSKSNEKAYAEAISHLNLMIKIFSEMRVGRDNRWKPVQTGVLIATNAILGLQNYFLNERGFKYLLTGRFTQDFVENIFSCIRFRQAVPNALAFKNLLKSLTIAQFCIASASGSYDQDDGEMVIDFLKNAKSVNTGSMQCKESELNISMDIPIVADECIAYFATWERLILYDMAGSTLHSVKNVYKVCDTCYNALLWQGEERHPYELVTQLNDYGDQCLVRVSEETFKATWKAELTFRLVREDLIKTKNINIYDVLVHSLQYVWASSSIPQCHNITTKMLRRYFAIRCKQYGQMKKEELKEHGNVFSSKSAAMHNLIK